MWKVPPGIGSESHEAGNQFGVDPVRLGSGAKAGSERLDLCGRQLPGEDTGIFQVRPETPFLTTCGFETDEGGPITCEFCQFPMARHRIRKPKPMAIRQAMDIQPVARDIYANDRMPMIAGCGILLMLSSFCFAVLVGRFQLFETMKRGGADWLRNVVMPQGSDVAHHPDIGPGQGR